MHDPEVDDIDFCCLGMCRDRDFASGDVPNPVGCIYCCSRCYDYHCEERLLGATTAGSQLARYSFFK